MPQRTQRAQRELATKTRIHEDKKIYYSLSVFVAKIKRGNENEQGKSEILAGDVGPFIRDGGDEFCAKNYLCGCGYRSQRSKYRLKLGECL